MSPRQKSDSPAADSLADRAARFFESQIAWCGCVLTDLESGQPLSDDERLDELEARRAVYDRDIADQERQLNALLAEWQQTPKPAEADLQRVRALARRAEEEAAKVAVKLQHAADGMGARAREVRQTLQSLQAGRRAFSGYRLIDRDMGRFDEKA